MIDEKINNDVNQFKVAIESSTSNILEVRSSYCSLLVIFDKEINAPSIRDWKNLKKTLKLFSKCEYNNSTVKILINIIKIPFF